MITQQKLNDFSDFENGNFNGWRAISGTHRTEKEEGNAYFTFAWFDGNQPYSIQKAFEEFPEKATVKFRMRISEGVKIKELLVGFGETLSLPPPKVDGKWHEIEAEYSRTYLLGKHFYISAEVEGNLTPSQYIHYDDISITEK